MISQDFEDDKINEAEVEDEGEDEEFTFVRKRVDSDRRINRNGRHNSFINPSDAIFKKPSHEANK
jgi:hypothetical protein